MILVTARFNLDSSMSERDLRAKYGGKLPKAINRAIRAELPGGNEALDKLTHLAAPILQAGWKDHAGNPTPEAAAYFKHQRKVVEPMEAEIRKRWGLPMVEISAKKSSRPRAPKDNRKKKSR
jgi:hypothetical protein